MSEGGGVREGSGKREKEPWVKDEGLKEPEKERGSGVSEGSGVRRAVKDAVICTHHDYRVLIPLVLLLGFSESNIGNDLFLCLPPRVVCVCACCLPEQKAL